MIEVNIPLPSVKSRKDKCCICHRRLHDLIIFPDDFPIEWRMCCNCFRYAGYIVYYGLKRVIGWFKSNNIFCLDKSTFIRRAKKIDKLVNLNDL